jgi:hypothetical protein
MDSGFVSGYASLKCCETKANSGRIGSCLGEFRAMHPVVAFLVNLLALYAVVGVVTALRFIVFGVTRVQPVPVSPVADQRSRRLSCL